MMSNWESERIFGIFLSVLTSEFQTILLLCYVEIVLGSQKMHKKRLGVFGYNYADAEKHYRVRVRIFRE